MIKVNPSVILRVVLCMIFGILLGGVIGEGSFQFLREDENRGPQRIELVIPRGTAERIASGEDTPAIPKDMTFFQGDVLVVKNEDVVSHQLGPIWVPSQSSSSMTLDQPNDYAYSCSFQTTRYLNLDVRSRVNVLTRIEGALTIGLPTGAMIAVYSFILFPIKAKNLGEGKNNHETRVNKS